MFFSAAKLGLLSKGSKGGLLQRGMSGRKAARSDYEEQQVLLGLKAVEKMKQMVLVSPCAQSTAAAHLDRSSLSLGSPIPGNKCVDQIYQTAGPAGENAAYAKEGALKAVRHSSRMRSLSGIHSMPDLCWVPGSLQTPASCMGSCGRV